MVRLLCTIWAGGSGMTYLSIGLGGGSLVQGEGERAGAGSNVRVGPVSVGYQLTNKARVFGGDTLTATDLAVAAGRLALGDPARLADLDPGLVEQAMEQVGEMIAVAVDRERDCEGDRDPAPQG